LIKLKEQKHNKNFTMTSKPNNNNIPTNTTSFDPYATLNVPRTASREEIKAAFLRFARILHPDKANNNNNRSSSSSSNNENDDLFVLIDRAWKILGQDEIREVYDELGEEGVKIHQQLQLTTQRKIGAKEITRLLTAVKSTEQERAKNVKTYIRAETSLEAIREFIELLFDRPEYATVPFLKGLFAQHSLDFELGKNTTFTITTVTGNRTNSVPNRKQQLQQRLEDQTLNDELNQNEQQQQENPNMFLNHFEDEDDDNEYDQDQKLFISPPQTFKLMSLGSVTGEIVHTHGVDVYKFRLGGASVGSSFQFAISAERSILFTKANVELSGGPTGKDGGLEFTFTRTLSETIEGNWTLGFGEKAGIGFGLIHNGTTVNNKTSTNTTSNSTTEQKNNYNEEDEDSIFAISRAMGTFLKSRHVETHCNVNSMLGMNFSFSWLESLSSRSKLRTTINFGSTAADVEIESMTLSYLTDSMRSIAVSVGLTGVYLKFRLGQSGRRIEFPIHITSSISLTHAFFSGLIPGLIQHFLVAFFTPIQQNHRIRQFEQLKVEWEAAKERAMKQIHLMRPIAEMRRKEQLLMSANGGGLIILKARYGGLGVRVPFWAANNNSNINESVEQQQQQIDVTIQLNFFVRPEGILQLRSGTKSKLMGFYNPCSELYYDDEKPPSLSSPADNVMNRNNNNNNKQELHLCIRYTFAQRVYEITYADEEEVHLPGDARAILIGTTLDNVDWGA
jgi:curved DNA-binding protein CbpA